MSSLLQLRVEPGQEVIETLTKQAAELGLQNGAIVSLIGAIDSCCISNMPSNDAMSDILTNYARPFELSGSGEIIDGRVHLHVTLSGEGEDTLHGHLHWAKVNTWYVAAYAIGSTERSGTSLK